MPRPLLHLSQMRKLELCIIYPFNGLQLQLFQGGHKSTGYRQELDSVPGTMI